MILDEIIADKKRIAAARPDGLRAELEQQARAAPAPRCLRIALARPADEPIRVIAEFKRRSPSAGEIRPGAQVDDIARRYVAAGARGLSVLTDTTYFGGTFDDLRAARAAASVPVLRKDFLLDEIDVLEARAAGADAILLIVRILDDETLRRLRARAMSLGMDVLVEAHDRREVDRALASGADLIGINHRDLDKLDIDLGRSRGAREWVGEGVVLVGESGIRTRDDVARMLAEGIDAILVGEHLMRAADPGQALEELRK